jgi:hypothetical protein
VLITAPKALRHAKTDLVTADPLSQRHLNPDHKKIRTTRVKYLESSGCDLRGCQNFHKTSETKDLMQNILPEGLSWRRVGKPALIGRSRSQNIGFMRLISLLFKCQRSDAFGYLAWQVWEIQVKGIPPDGSVRGRSAMRECSAMHTRSLSPPEKRLRSG